MPDDTQPIVSIVVSTRNSADTLALCLDSVAGQSYGSIELIVVDNHSIDMTLRLAQSYTERVFVLGPERSAQRNYGARAATGQYLLFVDSDMVLDEDVVFSCALKMRDHPDIGAIIIPERSLGEGFWARCKALERSCYVGDDSMEAARFFRRDVFERTGGYDELLNAGEDWDLSQRASQIARLDRVSSYITHLEGRLTLHATMRSKFYYGKTIRRYLAKNHADTSRQFRLIRPAFRRHFRRLIVQPHLAAGMITMKGCEMLAGATGLAVSLYYRWCWLTGS